MPYQLSITDTLCCCHWCGVKHGRPQGLHREGFASVALILWALVAIPTHKKASCTSWSDQRQQGRQIPIYTCNIFRPRNKRHTEKKLSLQLHKALYLLPWAEYVSANREPLWVPGTADSPGDLFYRPLTYLQSHSGQASGFTCAGFKCWWCCGGSQVCPCAIQDSISLLWSIMVISAAKPHITHASASNTSAQAAPIPTFSL